jgi:hypothetical protein
MENGGRAVKRGKTVSGVLFLACQAEALAKAGSGVWLKLLLFQKPETVFPNHRSRITTSSTSNCKLQTGNWKLQTANCKLETGNWKLQTGNWKLETANWKLETGNWKLETANWKLPSPNHPPSLLELPPSLFELWRDRLAWQAKTK